MAWCSHPANTVPCTNYATTYSSLTLASSCPSTSQVVLQGSTTCQATGDNFGDLGVYTSVNTTCGVTCYDYTLTVNGVSYGPYVWTSGGSGAGSTVAVNGIGILNPNFNDSTPSADPGYTNGAFKTSGSNVSVEMPNATASAGTPLSSLQWNNASVISGATGTKDTPATGADRIDIADAANAAHNTLFNWTATPSSPSTITAGSPTSVTLAVGPAGIDASGLYNYQVLVTQGATIEPALVTGGTCVTGATSCTVTITTVNNYTAGYTVGSASSGIQEALNFLGAPIVPNQMLVIDPVGANTNAALIYGKVDGVTIHNSRTRIVGDASEVKCITRGACFMLGTEASPNTYTGEFMSGLRMQAGTSHTGYHNTTFVLTSNVVTLTTAETTDLVIGDKVIIQDIQIAGTPLCNGLYKVLSVPTTSTFTYACTHANVSSTSVWGATNIENGAVEDNANSSKFDFVRLMSGAAISPTGKFNVGFVADDDEAMVIEQPDTEGSSSAMLCDSSWCAPYIYSPASLNNGTAAAVLTVQGGQINLQCGGNGIDWQSGNTLHVIGTVVQGQAQYAVRTTASFGSNPAAWLAGNYGEVGVCTNPLGYGIAGVITNKGHINLTSNVGPTGKIKSFAATGSTALTAYLVPVDSGKGTAAPLLIGTATVNSGDTPTFLFPEIGDPSTTTYTFVIGPTLQTGTPNTTNCAGGAFPACGILTSGVSPSSICTNGKCSQTLTMGTTSAYTYNDGYFPYLSFWPDALVLGSPTGADTTSLSFPTSVVADIWQNPTAANGSLTSVLGSRSVSLFATQCDGPPTPNNSAIIQCGGFDALAMPHSAGRVIPIGGTTGSFAGGYTGYIDFIDAFKGGASGIGPTHIITLRNSNGMLTQTTPGYQDALSNHANDTYIGYDQTTSVAPASNRLAFGAPLSISNYLGNTGDGTSWLERLTTSLKSFKVPLSLSSYADDAEIAAPSNPAASTCRLYINSTTHVLSGLNSSGGSCIPTGISYPGAGIPVSTGSAWGTSLTETDGDIIAGVSSAWTKTVTLPNGILGTTQSPGDNSTKIATTAYTDTALAVKLNTANSVPAGTFDGSGLTQLKLPVGAGFNTAATGEIGYDSTSKNWHVWKNGADALMSVFSGVIADGDCPQISVSGGITSLIDAGGPCGTSSMVYPGAGVSVSTGSAWAASLTAPSGGTTQLTGTVFHGTLVMPTSLILSATNSSVVTVPASGVLTTDNVTAGFNGDPTLVVGFLPSTSGGLNIFCWPTADNVNCKYQNNTSASITPGAVTLNITVTR